MVRARTSVRLSDHLHRTRPAVHVRLSARLRAAGRLRPASALAALALAGTLAGTVAASPVSAAGAPRGHDVSAYQKKVNWSKARARGATFVYVKATESTSYRNPYFAAQYAGARSAGIVRGAYHFALPDRSSGRTQADYLVNHGGAWKADGRTLPPALDLEPNPYNHKHGCYGLTRAATVSWIRSFSDEVRRRTGRRPVIYTTTRWWKACTGSSRAFASTHALWIARHGTKSAGQLPAGWSYWTFWQYDDNGRLPGDQNLFNGSAAALRKFARGH